MRRSPTPVSAWPAIADLMTLCAIVGLGAAAVVGARAAASGEELEELRNESEELRATLDDMEHSRSEVEELQATVDDLLQRLAEADKDRGIDQPPCLGSMADGGVRPLFSVTVNRGYALQQLWQPDDAEGTTLPSFLTEQPARELSVDEFLDRGKRIYAFGDRPDTFGGRCRFYVELRRGPLLSRVDYLDARHLVETCFFFSNSSEVRRDSVRDR